MKIEVKHSWRSFPKDKPQEHERRLEFLVATPNPTKNQKDKNSFAPDFWLTRAIYLESGFLSLERDFHFSNNDVVFFFPVPPTPSDKDI